MTMRKRNKYHVNNPDALFPPTEGKNHLYAHDGVWSSGLWLYGDVREDMDPHNRWAVDPNGFTFGYGVVPQDNPYMGKCYTQADLHLPCFSHEHEDDYYVWDQITIDMHCIEGGNKGLKASYRTVREYILNRMVDLAKQIRQRRIRDDDKQVPVVTLTHHPDINLKYFIRKYHG